MIAFLLSIAVSFQCLCISVNAETDINGTSDIGTVTIDITDYDVAELTLTEGEPIQLVIPDDPDMPEINYVAFYSSKQTAAVSHDLKLTGICEGEDCVTVYIGYKGTSYVRDIDIKVNILKNDSIPAENRSEMERLSKYSLCGFLRRRIELSGGLDENSPRLDMEKVNEIISTSDDYLDIYRRFNEYHGYPDAVPNDSGSTHYLYWLDKKGNEYIELCYEEETVYHGIVADNGTEYAGNILYPQKYANELQELKTKFTNHYYTEYNQITPEGYGTLNLKFIDESTGKAFTETSGTFQLMAEPLDGDKAEEVYKSWNITDDSTITINELPRDLFYILVYADEYHRDENGNQYKYEIDTTKQTHNYSFQYTKEYSFNVYLKRHYITDPVFIKGDINGDEEFNVADVVVLQKWMLGYPDIELKAWKNGDLCEDDVLNVLDLCIMKQELIK